MKTPKKKYQIILADPPWLYNARNNPETKFGGGAAGHYPLMTTEDICKMPVREWAEDSSVLFLWTTFPRLQDGLQVIHAWGFDYKTVGFVWVKASSCQPVMPALKSVFPHSPATPFFGTGFYTKSNAECCLLATRGKVMHPATNHVSNLVITERLPHSQKPDEVQYRIEALYPDTTRLEIFARRRRDGWDAYGNEV